MELSIDGGYDGSQSSLTRAELEQYSRAYEEVRAPSHSQQPSYAQSEGYHSYVSSSDSTTTTPFLDRLRRENETGRESSASSGSSSETLKWHGSLSDVSSTPQHIAHSARVPMPQRHHSESVLYLEPWPQPVNNNNMRRLFPVSTYEPTAPRYILSNDRSPPKLSVAERICEIERRGNNEDKRRGMTDHASLKAIQKKALLSFYERHASAWKSEPQLTAPSIPPQPPPRPPPQTSRRSSSASDYAGAMKREIPRNSLDMSKSESNGMRDSKHQHSSSCGSLTTASLGPMIIGPSICVDDWVPARPPKKPHLRAAYPHPPSPSSPASPNILCRPDPPYPVPRPASPEPPPPSPPPPPEAETYPDEPLPPPPPEVQQGYTSRRYERAMNASLSLDNLTRSDKHSLLHSKSHDSCNDGFYENGMEIKRNEHNKNGFTYADKFNERFVENRIESMQTNYCDQLNELWDKKNYLDMRKYSEKKQPEAQVRTSILSPPLPNKKRSHNEQPRSLDSNLSLVESNNEVNKPGPQTPIHKKYSAQMNINGHEKQINYKNIRENFLRAVSVPSEPQLMKNTPERQSLRFTTSTQKLLVNGKIANAIHNGKISPPSRKANLVRTPSDVVRRVAGIHHAEPLGKNDSLPKPTLPPHCPPTTLQL
ncbi:unnamed protein product [Nezara viridula]|uniref:Protein Shroom n=1 Tax=Nezara viridula TaxID=85310 RepID=A0A9P0E1J8_NEZVI|nr:unnamed protein product [Nezara viridula]